MTPEPSSQQRPLPMQHHVSGSGPGPRTPDGCSVELYRHLPYLGELRDIEEALPRAGSALELGCGTGRLCERLSELGLRVTGVDGSTEMLDHLPASVEGIEASIEPLDLGRCWSVVLLPSHLIHHPDERTSDAFVAAARRHLDAGGVFFLQRYPALWLATLKPGLIGESKGFRLHADHVDRDGNRVTFTLRYEGFGHRWAQTSTALMLSEADIERKLQTFGFDRVQWFGAAKTWASAIAADDHRGARHER